jgi:hypothetical protein
MLTRAAADFAAATVVAGQQASKLHRNLSFALEFRVGALAPLNPATHR